MQPIPELAPDGFLPPGEWVCFPHEVSARFGGSIENLKRLELCEALEGLFDFGRSLGASRALVGGSFVSAKVEPRDVDVVLVFDEANQIPDQTERLDLHGGRLDVFYTAADRPEMLGALVGLLSRNRKGRAVGILDVALQPEAAVDPLDYDEPRDELRAAIEESYFNRHTITVDRHKKLLITVHGILSQGEWSAEVCHIASSRGWIVAPFTYDAVNIDIFANERRRLAIVDEFRSFVDDMDSRYSAKISVLAHSFGTYVVSKYCTGFDKPPVILDTVIFTGSVLSRSFDLDRLNGRVAKLLNEVGEQDSIVDWAKWAAIGDPDFGDAGRHGFDHQTPLLEQRNNAVFAHNNVIKRDVIAKLWMPWLEANAARGRPPIFDDNDMIELSTTLRKLREGGGGD